MRSITKLDLQYAHRFYGFKGEAQYLHGHTGVLTIEVEDSINPGVNMAFPCNEIQKTAWNVLKNFDHALILREDDPLLPAVLDVYEKQGMIRDDQTAVFRLLDRIIIKALAYMGTALLETGVLVASNICGK